MKDEAFHINLIGEVIEIFEKEGINFAKILYNEGIIEVSTHKLEGLHLGDKVNIESCVNVESLKQDFSEQQNKPSIRRY